MARKLTAALLPYIEDGLTRLHAGNTTPVVVILGPPRSGTTLLYQSMVHAWRWSYFSTDVERNISLPVLTTFLKRRQIKRYRSTFTSSLGTTELSGPAEARTLWAHYFGWEEEFKVVRPEELRKKVEAVSHILDAPFLTKNPDHTLHIRKLEATFDRVCYIRVARDPAEIIRSILHARLKVDQNWFGVKPPGWRDVEDLSLAEQVRFQVAKIDELLRVEFEDKINPARRITVDYASFCRNPAAVLSDLSRFLTRNGIVNEERGTLPAYFERPQPRPLPDSIERDLMRSMT